MQSILDGNLYEPMIFTLLLSCARCAVASSISNTISISFTVYAMHEHVCLWKSPCVYYVCLSFALKYLRFRNAFFVRFRINVGVQTQWFILKRIHRDKASERERWSHEFLTLNGIFIKNVHSAWISVIDFSNIFDTAASWTESEFGDVRLQCE